MTRSLVALLVMLALFAMAAVSCAPSEADERKLVVYTAGPRGVAEVICDAFTAETGIAIELFSATTGQVLAKLEAEKYNPRADIVILASGFAAEWLKRENRLLPYHPSWLDETHTAWHDPDDAYFATSAAAVGIAVRRDAHRPDLEWCDFFNDSASSKGRFAGRAIMPAPSRSGSSSDFVLTYMLSRDEDRVWQDFITAKRNGLEIAGANSQAITNLLIGSHDAIVGAADYLVYREIARGEPIVMHFPPSGAPVITRPIAILKSTRRAETAMRFIDHYFSEASQARLAAVHLLPARTSTPLSAARADQPLPPTIGVNIDDVLRHQRRILRRFQYEIERASSRERTR
ncbi:MAG TPA: extracellular solute-binding protein [Phycisphaerales bacterium]|nr:extracellular solute-binding protein [Phycisphaerales bacterium]HRQ76217.1 extracellular solute-binding protein [Phycisphaerales bacterium]